MIVLHKIRTHIPRISVGEQLIGDLNGINKVFRTNNNFVSGKITIHYNGQSLHGPDDFSETGPDEITLNEIVPYSDDADLRATYELIV